MWHYGGGTAPFDLSAGRLGLGFGFGLGLGLGLGFGLGLGLGGAHLLEVAP